MDHGVDQHVEVRAGDLDQAHLRPVGRFAVEFGVDGQEFAIRQPGAGLGQLGGIADQPKLAGLIVAQITGLRFRPFDRTPGRY